MTDQDGPRYATVHLRVEAPAKGLEGALDLAEDLAVALTQFMPQVVPGDTAVTYESRRHRVFCNRPVGRGGLRCVLRRDHPSECSPKRPEEEARDLTTERFGVDPRQPRWQG